MGIIRSIIDEYKKEKRDQERKSKLKTHHNTPYYGNNPRTQTQKTHQSSNFANPTRRFPTLKGEMVRSLSEKYIADYLFTHGITYQYERRLVLQGKEIKPDFYLPSYNIYIEFWGMLDNQEYFNNFRWKIDIYQRNHVKFIPLNPNDLPSLETNFPLKLQIALGLRL